MRREFRIGILGNGRIAKAVAYYFKKNKTGRISFLTAGKDARHCDLLVGALAGELGAQGLSLALKYRKNLLDISDIDPPFYLAKAKEIAKAAITVIPGCGFSPGLVNFILGREALSAKKIKEIGVKAGSLSPKKFFFPFLWCFEDLILEHQIPSMQVISGKKVKLPAFAGYKKEKFFGIEAESYFCASGFENIFEKVRPQNFECRVVRPAGFMHFFNFLKNYNLLQAKGLLEAKKEDNFTLAEITISAGKKKIRWMLKSFSLKNEPLNSMQKITASVPAVVGKLLLENKIRGKGVLFMEELGKDRSLFAALLRGIRQEGILLKRYD